MGEMADALIDEGMCGDDFRGFGSRACKDPPRRKMKICWFCGTKGLQWVKVRTGPADADEKWRLADKNDNVHNCSNKTKARSES